MTIALCGVLIACAAGFAVNTGAVAQRASTNGSPSRPAQSFAAADRHLECVTVRALGVDEVALAVAHYREECRHPHFGDRRDDPACSISHGADLVDDRRPWSSRARVPDVPADLPVPRRGVADVLVLVVVRDRPDDTVGVATSRVRAGRIVRASAGTDARPEKVGKAWWIAPARHDDGGRNDRGGIVQPTTILGPRVQADAVPSNSLGPWNVEQRRIDCVDTRTYGQRTRSEPRADRDCGDAPNGEDCAHKRSLVRCGLPATRSDCPNTPVVRGRDRGLTTVVWITDRGMASDVNLAVVRVARLHSVIGAPPTRPRAARRDPHRRDAVRQWRRRRHDQRTDRRGAARRRLVQPGESVSRSLCGQLGLSWTFDSHASWRVRSAIGSRSNRSTAVIAASGCLARPRSIGEEPEPHCLNQPRVSATVTRSSPRPMAAMSAPRRRGRAS